jgi:2-haloacid dehalogenase
MDLMVKALIFDAYGTLYDVQSVADITEAAFPGHGDYVTQIWRMKQLEYSWLRSLMGRYEDFWTVTQESLDYTLHTLGLEPPPKLFDDLAEAFNRLRPYADAQEALRSLSRYRLAILSNGSAQMLTSLVRNSGLDRYLEKTISVHPKRVFKPDPRAYALAEEELGVKPADVLFVSSNGFDICGANELRLQGSQDRTRLSRGVAAGADDAAGYWSKDDVQSLADATRMSWSTGGFQRRVSGRTGRIAATPSCGSRKMTGYNARADRFARSKALLP